MVGEISVSLCEFRDEANNGRRNTRSGVATLEQRNSYTSLRRPFITHEYGCLNLARGDALGTPGPLQSLHPEPMKWAIDRQLKTTNVGPCFERLHLFLGRRKNACSADGELQFQRLFQCQLVLFESNELYKSDPEFFSKSKSIR
jgi:hypothetical protein